MTWFAAAEGTTPTAHETEEQALAAAAALGKRVAVVWEVDEGEA